jgi:TPR repeat protein
MLTMSRYKPASALHFNVVIYSKADLDNIEIKNQYLKKLNFDVFQSSNSRGNIINLAAIDLVEKHLIAKTRSGDSEADYQLGIFNQQLGKYLKSSIHERFAYHCFCQAADKGHSAAQCKLGEIFLQGLEELPDHPAVFKDLSCAVAWLKIAIEQDNAKAKYLYAEHFVKLNIHTEESGQNNQRDTFNVLYQRLINEAADAGYAVAKLKLIELTQGSDRERMTALVDVIDLYKLGNESLSIEPDSALANEYLEIYWQLHIKEMENYMPTRPVLI